MAASDTPTLKMTIDLTEDAVGLIRSEIALAFEQYKQRERWLTSKQAAEYLSCPVFAYL